MILIKTGLQRLIKLFTNFSMFLIDSNIIISYFRAEEARHKDAMNFLDSLSEFAISEYVLSEIATIILFKSGMSVVKDVLDFFQNNREISILRLDEEEMGETLALFLKQKRKISYVDISLIVLAKSRGLQLATLDTELSKTAKELFSKK